LADVEARLGGCFSKSSFERVVVFFYSKLGLM